MNDEETPWIAPGGAAPGPAAPGPSAPGQSAPGARPQPQYGEYAQPGWIPPQASSQPGWAPPPKPGLIPLRPLGLGDITAAAFQVIRRNPRPTFGFALVISIVIGVLAAGIVGLVTWAVLGRIDMASTDDVEVIRSGGVFLIAASGFIAAIVQLALSAIPQGVVSIEVARATLGERHTLRELWTWVRPRIGALIGWTLLLGGALALVLVVAVLPVIALVLAYELAAAIAVAIIIGVVVGLAIFALSIWLGTKLEFVPPLILIERLSIRAAVRRSWAMTRGGFWRIFGITLLINLIVQIAAQIVTTPITLVGTLTGTLVNPNQSADAVDTTTLVTAILAILVGIVLNAVIIVAQSAVPTLLYLDVRMRKEGFDLVLQRYAEETAAGRPAADPFEAPAPQRPAGPTA